MIKVKEKNNTGNSKIKSIKGDVYFVPIVDGKEYSYAAETSDVALLLGLQIKYDGLNSQFCRSSCRMLNIKSNWSK